MKGFQTLIALFLTIVCVSDAAFKPGLKVKFDAGLFPWSSKSYFYNVPLTKDAALKDGWEECDRPEGHRPSLELLCPKDPHLSGYYDADGNVAGLQICVPTLEFTGAIYDWATQGFTKWTHVKQGVPTEYQCTAQFFVSDEYLQKSAEERLASQNPDKFLREGKIWLTGFNGKLDEWSDKTSEIEQSIWTKQACIPWMGQHYYYNMSSTTPCQADTLYPWFPLVDSGNIVATGFIVFGKLPIDKSRRDWFERPPKLAVMGIVPRGPQCLYEQAGSVGLLTMHIYYVTKPWTILCPLF